jgi:hypothetical protein
MDGYCSSKWPSGDPLYYGAQLGRQSTRHGSKIPKLTKRHPKPKTSIPQPKPGKPRTAR